MPTCYKDYLRFLFSSAHGISSLACLFTGYVAYWACVIWTCVICLVAVSLEVCGLQLQKENFGCACKKIWKYLVWADIYNLFDSMPCRIVTLIAAPDGYTKYLFQTLNIFFFCFENFIIYLFQYKPFMHQSSFNSGDSLMVLRFYKHQYIHNSQ